jgi:hypothetical protein
MSSRHRASCILHLASGIPHLVNVNGHANVNEGILHPAAAQPQLRSRD